MELKAAIYLKKQGLTLIEKNYQCRSGEIDLVMFEGNSQLVFVEVRYRKNAKFGSALESVNLQKQTKIRRTAAHFLLSHPQLNSYSCRFDVIGMSEQARDQICEIQWIKNAFL